MSVFSDAMQDLGLLIELANANMKVLPGPIYNVTGYGAVGDGLTDDTAAVQAAINAAVAAGYKAVWLPHGVYKCSSLSNASQVLFIGDSASFSGVNYVVNQFGSGIYPSTASISLYVNPTTGSDSNTGTAALPLRTINKALSLIPRACDHDIFILCNTGTYAEDVLISGFSGKGTLQLLGGGSTAAAANYLVNKIHYRYNTMPVYVKGFTATTTTDIGFLAGYNPGYSEMHWCRCVASTTSFRGIGNYYSPYVLLNQCEVSNRSVGIYTAGGRTWGLDHSGSSNVVGLYAEKLGIYGKSGTQPGGTTAEGTASGGSVVSAPA